MPRFLLAGLVFALVSTGSAWARAADSERAEPNFTDHRFGLQLRSGVATSVGFVGALGEFNLHDRLAVNAGVGTNFYGLSSAFGVRLRPLIFTSRGNTRLPIAWALTLEGSVSRGAVGEQPDLAYCIEECVARKTVLTRTVNWGQLELGAEMRANHYQFLSSLGGAGMLGHPRISCVQQPSGATSDCTDEQRVPTRVIVITFAIGYVF